MFQMPFPHPMDIVKEDQLALLPEEHRYLAMVFMCTDPYAQQWIRYRLTMENEMRAEGQTDRYCQSVFAVVPSISTYIDEFFTGNEILLRRWRCGKTEMKIGRTNLSKRSF